MLADVRAPEFAPELLERFLFVAGKNDVNGRQVAPSGAPMRIDREPQSQAT